MFSWKCCSCSIL